MTTFETYENLDQQAVFDKRLGPKAKVNKKRRTIVPTVALLTSRGHLDIDTAAAVHEAISEASLPFSHQVKPFTHKQKLLGCLMLSPIRIHDLFIDRLDENYDIENIANNAIEFNSEVERHKNTKLNQNYGLSVKLGEIAVSERSQKGRHVAVINLQDDMLGQVAEESDRFARKLTKDPSADVIGDNAFEIPVFYTNFRSHVDQFVDRMQGSNLNGRWAMLTTPDTVRLNLSLGASDNLQ